MFICCRGPSRRSKISRRRAKHETMGWTPACNGIAVCQERKASHFTIVEPSEHNFSALGVDLAKRRSQLHGASAEASCFSASGSPKRGYATLCHDSRVASRRWKRASSRAFAAASGSRFRPNRPTRCRPKSSAPSCASPEWANIEWRRPGPSGRGDRIQGTLRHELKPSPMAFPIVREAADAVGFPDRPASGPWCLA